MSKVMTARELIEWLSKFPPETEVTFQSDYDDSGYMDTLVPVPADVAELASWNTDKICYTAAREAWTYVPSEMARAAGLPETSYPATPPMLEIEI